MVNQTAELKCGLCSRQYCLFHMRMHGQVCIIPSSLACFDESGIDWCPVMEQAGSTDVMGLSTCDHCDVICPTAEMFVCLSCHALCGPQRRCAYCARQHRVEHPLHVQPEFVTSANTHLSNDFPTSPPDLSDNADQAAALVQRRKFVSSSESKQLW